MTLSTEQISSILDRVRNPLDSAGVKYSGIAYDDHTAIYDIYLATEGYDEPHHAQIKMKAVLKGAGYSIERRQAGFVGGEWFMRFTIYRAA